MIEFLKDSLAVLLALLIAVLAVVFTGALMVVQAFVGLFTAFIAVGGLAYIVIGSWLHERKSSSQDLEDPHSKR
jgi:membrane-bound ClpP family serine protease